MEQTLSTPFLPPVTKAEAGTKPKPEPARPPLFIQDAVTPFGDGTLLLALWRMQDAEGQDGAGS
ncbi:hypothetical protein K3722_01840 [Leisingera caerulea]|uniref:Uncharacterized protein n=1 Tax=Leisingera caerulea TaxID=506591 RepID=A0A9Q9HI18_LEICA|nr:hypothetical protein [Leisingera caerulea]UWQ50214.1 hypothetical protein K3720_02055 [Leisingera caerulea]UWQ54302.1 hypothetical protein K3721_01830 [Leisingera caerulea]UWQ58900.1 hypothetical protein K3722_01840 [Leisingera caerulea]UWQ83949.1 hypothetical protein K3726_01735 [Leisingera caerulea]